MPCIVRGKGEKVNNIIVRLATLSDAAAITAVHCSTVGVWRDPVTRSSTTYENLGLFGRWYNGGPWMSVETCAVHLNHMLCQGHLPFVAEVSGTVVGEVEYYIAREPPPFGPYLHVSILYIHKDWQGRGVGRALLNVGIEQAQSLGLTALTTEPEVNSEDFYRRMGFSLWLSAKEMQASVGGGLPGGLTVMLKPRSVPEELALRIGRYQCGAQGWDSLWPVLMLPGWCDLRRKVWHGELQGTPLLLGLREQLSDPQQADGYAWLSPDAPLLPAVSALRALAAAEGFSAVDLLLPEEEVPVLKEALPLAYQTTIALWRRDVEFAT